MAWFKRNRGTQGIERKAVLGFVNNVLDVLLQEEETHLTINAHSVGREKFEMYAKEFDKLLGVKGKPESSGLSRWITWWVKGKLSVTIFLEW